VNYYNENDPKAAAWLGELIRSGEIPAGHIDTRSITEIKACELTDYNQCHFFAGIGGWAVALKLAGWPQNRRVWTGSCPCQPFSVAGAKLAENDPRHLWPFFRNLICESCPSAVFGEQVGGGAGFKWFAGVRADLEKAGYAVGGADLCAASVAAPHKRQRIYWVAISCRNGRGTGSASIAGQEGGDALINDRSESGSPSESDGMVLSNGAGRSERGQTAKGTRQGSATKPTSSVSGGEHALRTGCEMAGNTEHHGVENEIGQTNRLGSNGNAVGVALGDSDSERPQGLLECGKRGGKLTPWKASAWSNFDIVWCRNPKKPGEIVARRVEPGTFPLAHGVSGRVGLLRGYGNAIVPQVAAEFIKATMI
jgi:DNA (cytosine-5)-methyltransferase 1